MQLEDLLPSGAGLIGTIISLVAMWSKFQHKVERLEETDKEQDRQIKAMWDWKDALEKDIYAVREKYNDRMAKIEGANLVVTEQFKQILSILSEIKERISILESHKKN